MIRILLTYVLPLILPTVLYLLWLRFAVARGRAPEVPYVWLLLAGLVLVTITVFGLTLSGGTPTGRYQPPHLEDGRVVPGRVVR
jgi:hypothetical protein